MNIAFLDKKSDEIISLESKLIDRDLITYRDALSDNPHAGAYYEISDDIYFSMERKSRSDFASYLGSPKNFKRKTVKTDAMVFGNYFHTLVLEPEAVPYKYFHLSKGQRVSKKLREENPTRTLINFTNQLLAANMSESLRWHKKASSLLNRDDVLFEKVFLTQELRCKIDIFDYKNKTIYDLKTCQSCSERDVINSIHKYKLNFQAYFYRKIIKEVTGEEFNFSFIFVEKSNQSPEVRIVDLDREVIDEAELLYKIAEQRMKYAKKNNSEYDNGDSVKTSDLENYQKLFRTDYQFEKWSKDDRHNKPEH